MQWSYSRLKKFLTCPRQYAAIRVKKTCVEDKLEAANYGKEVHQAFEDFILKKTPLPENYKKFKPILNAVNQIPGDKYTEMELGLDEKRKPCLVDYRDPNLWVSCIIDLFIFTGSTAFILDYKTGKSKYADLKQLKLAALIVFHTFPMIEVIRAGLIFVSNGDFRPDEYKRENMNLMWTEFERDVKRLEQAYQDDWWPENPSGLCKKHCPDLSCAHNGRGR